MARKKKTVSAADLVRAVDIARDIQRVRTFKPNGATARVIAPEPAGIVLPSPDEAVKVMARLADLNVEAKEAFEQYEHLKGKTKAAKDEYDGLMAEIGQVIHKATHEAPMPLFDAAQREKDQQTMEQAAQKADSAGQDAPETTNDRPDAVGAVPVVDVVPEPLPADAEVF